MHNHPFIMIYGRDESLLETRSWVLRAAGFQVKFSIVFREIEHMVREMCPDLMVLCHTLSREDHGRVKALSQSLGSAIPLLILTASDADTGEDDGGLIPTVSAGPLQMVAKVRELLSGQGVLQR